MLYVHIGFRKAGSTSIQYFLAQNAEALAALGVLYPHAGRAGLAHVNLVDELRGSASYDATVGGVRELRGLLAAEPQHRVIVSSEGLHILKPKAVRRLADNLMGQDVKVLAYVRHLPNFVDSQYRQSIKSGKRAHDFDDFFRAKAGVEAEGYAQNVFGQLETWAQVFGWSALRVRMLDPANLAGGDLLTDLLEALGLTWADLPQVERDGAAWRNASPGWKVIELIRRLNQGLGPLDEAADGYALAHQAAVRLRRHAERIGDKLSISAERGDYLSKEQWVLCRDAGEQLRARLNAVLDDAPLRPPSETASRPRGFLPEASHVPTDERLAFYEQLSLALAWEARRRID